MKWVRCDAAWWPSLAVLLALLWPGASGAFDPAAYVPIELKAVPPLTPAVTDGRSFQLDAAHPRYRTRATFTGNTRPLSGDVRMLVRLWRQAMQHPPAYDQLFVSEVEVMQDGQRYWMPIQQPLMAPFIAEVHKGHPVTLYVLLLGGIDGMPVLTVSEFQAGSTSPPVRPDGVGALRVGMSLRQMERALKENIARPADPDDQHCFYIDTKAFPGVGFMIEGGRLRRMDVSEAGVPTDDGLQVGDPVEKVKARYGARLKVEPHFYGGLPDTYLTARFRSGTLATRFEVHDNRIQSIQTGAYRQVRYVEGCS